MIVLHMCEWHDGILVAVVIRLAIFRGGCRVLSKGGGGGAKYEYLITWVWPSLYQSWQKVSNQARGRGHNQGEGVRGGCASSHAKCG